MSAKYTLTDWINGKPTNWVQILDKQGEFSSKQIAVRNQIKDAKKKAWNWLIELNTESWLKELENEPEGFIEAFKKEKLKFFDENLDLVKKFEKGQIEGIDHKMYKKLEKLFKEYHNKGGFHIGVNIQKEGKKHPGRLQDVYVFKRVLDHLDEKNEPQSKPKPTNKTAKKMYKKAEENQPKKEAIIKKAVELIHKTGSEYRTKSNNCQKWLWDHPKIKKVDSGNARGWLNNAVKSGTIEKRLKKLSTE